MSEQAPEQKDERADKVRRHFLNEWLKEGPPLVPKGPTSVPALIIALNAIEAQRGLTFTVKDLVYKYLKGTKPGPDKQKLIAEALDIRDEQGNIFVDAIMTDPLHWWITRKTHNRSDDELKTFRRVVDAALPDRT